MPPKVSHKWKYNPEYMELMNFLIERTKNAKSAMSVTQLAVEFQSHSGAFLTLPCLTGRIRKFRSEIQHMDSFDTESKVRMLVALGTPADWDFLKELRKDAHVEIDFGNRITKYRAKDGSLILEGDHTHSAKSKLGQAKRRNIVQDFIPKTPEFVAPEVPNSPKRARDSSPVQFIKIEDPDPDDSARIQESRESRAREPFSPNFGYNFPEDSSRIPESRESRILVRRISPNPGIPILPRLGAPIFRSGWTLGSPGARWIFRSGGLPRASGSPGSYIRVPLRAPGPPGPFTLQGIPTRPRSEAISTQTPQIKFLEAIQSLVLFLGIHDTEIHRKIQQKIQNNDGFTTIQNNEVTLSLELLLARIVNHSVPNLPEYVKSVSLKEFLCYLKAAILNSRLEGLEGLMEKIEENIKEPDSKDKNIPVEKVTKVLQDTLNNVEF